MNLIIDVGNSFVKLAVFQADKFIHKEQVELSNLLVTVEKLKSSFPLIKDVIIASVNTLPDQDREKLASRFNLLELSWKTKLPFKNHYKTPETLGVDRLALISAAVHQYPDRNVLIIDAGTCVTFDFKDSENNYLGGAISPGLRMRYKAMHNFTAKLPVLDPTFPRHFVGNTTAEAMHSGVVNGLVNEIDGVIRQYEQDYSDLTVILTGGDAKFLSKQLKSSIFANSNFLLEGLNHILNFNSI
ncbi:type III pantothenate kinase [Gaetbulibacter aestuarii]|uniref:Type III pantothenate kinase n=1 Tax=Gaetbulibacter aestuarii TaxID=1502358 RepID=A0ABW7N244_9FLAO